MHVFDYKEKPEKLLTPEVVNQLGKLHELKGHQAVSYTHLTLPTKISV